MAAPKQIKKQEDEKTIWQKIVSLIEQGRRPSSVSLDEYLALGQQNGQKESNKLPTRVTHPEKEKAIVARREGLAMRIEPDAVRIALKLKRALDEAARHGEPEQLIWG